MTDQEIEQFGEVFKRMLKAARERNCEYGDIEGKLVHGRIVKLKIKGDIDAVHNGEIVMLDIES